MTIYERIELENKESFEIYGHFNSTHEIYGVLKEEVDEFFDCVKNRQTKEMYIHELIQIASIAIRGINELRSNKINIYKMN